MFISHLKKKRQINGFIEKNCLEPSSIQSWHDSVADEMIQRSYNHRTPLIFEQLFLQHLPSTVRVFVVNSFASLLDLLCRCESCSKRYIETHK
jgi:hypothetical protein